MRRSLAAAVPVTVAAALLGATHGGEAKVTSDAALELTGTRPVAVHGTDFLSQERVTVVLRRPSGAYRRRVTASTGGAFSLTFRRVMLDRCDTFSIRAKGGDGSRAGILRRPRAGCIPP